MPLADHSTSKPRSASSAVISSAVSLSSSIRSTFAINSFSIAAKTFAVPALRIPETVRLPETNAIMSTTCKSMDFAVKEPDSAARLIGGIRRGVRRPLYGHPNTASGGKRGGAAHQKT